MGARVLVDGSAVRRRRQALPGRPSLRSTARAARVSGASLSRIENGLQGAERATVARLAAALRCPAESLLSRGRPPRTDRDLIEELQRRVATLEAALRRR